MLGVVGWSGSGKTTLLEHLIERLAGQGLRVNIVKHSHHDIELEAPRKDSARLRMAGAAEVMIASPYRVAILRELIEAGKIKPVIDRRYGLTQVPEALRYLESGEARGKIVITI